MVARLPILVAVCVPFDLEQLSNNLLHRFEPYIREFSLCCQTALTNTCFWHRTAVPETDRAAKWF